MKEMQEIMEKAEKTEKEIKFGLEKAKLRESELLTLL